MRGVKVGDAGQAFVVAEKHFTDCAVALLCHYQCPFTGDGVAGQVFEMVVFGTVNEYHFVGVLLYCPGFAKVGKHGLFVGSLFARPIELREEDKRYVQLFGDYLCRAAGLCHFLLPVLPFFAHVGKLEIVYQHHPAFALFGHFLGVGADVPHGDDRVVVHVNREGGKRFLRRCHCVEIFV